MRECEYCGNPLADDVDSYPACGAPCPPSVANGDRAASASSAISKPPSEWVFEYFQDSIDRLSKKKFGVFNPTYALLATETQFPMQLTKSNFTAKLKEFRIAPDDFDYERCVMVFDNMSTFLGKNTRGGVITLDGIWWSYNRGIFEENLDVDGFKWSEIENIVQKNKFWKGDFLEIDGEYVIIEAMWDFYLGKDNFARFLSAISGKEVVRG